MASFQDYSGRQFGRLTVIKRLPNVGAAIIWECRCDCGRLAAVRAGNLRSGNSTSCGCVRNKKTAERSTKHGHSRAHKRTPEYIAWKGMIARCHSSPSRRDWERYGGRGISVCDVWRTSFQEFYDHIGPRPSPKHSVDRIDNNLGYQPGNVRWATATSQARNTRRNRRYPVSRGLSCLAELAERAGINYSTAKDRLRRGWAPSDVVSTPVRKPPAFEYKGRAMPLAELVRNSSLSRSGIQRRLDAGWSVTDAVETPAIPRGTSVSSTRRAG